MRIEKAKNNYLGRSENGRMNCCEAVAYAFRDVIPLTEEELRPLTGFGGGRAPEGYCGAIFAAKFLLEKKGSSKAAEIPGIFEAFAGSAKCREIKLLRKISCVACVERAAQEVEEQIGHA